MFSATDLEIEETTRQKIGILADNVIELLETLSKEYKINYINSFFIV